MDINTRLAEVEVFLNVAHLGVRDSICSLLRNLGVRRVVVGQSLAELSTHMSEESPDLLISSTHFTDGELFPKLRELRHHEWGKNPFVPIITITGEPSTDVVKQVLESGADDLLVQPISTTQLLGRIVGLTKNRKPFVVTTDYVGPTRRAAGTRRGMEIPMFDVPNTLRSKITGRGPCDPADLAEAIEHTLGIINVQKVERHGFQLAYLAERIVSPENPNRLLADAAENLDKMITTVERARRRIAKTKYAHVASLCGSLMAVACKIRDAGEQAEASDRAMLNPLANSIQQAVTDNDANEDNADEDNAVETKLAAGASTPVPTKTATETPVHSPAL